tara:strand:- start:403 stop:1296 length:894 start_codon:yes stop_codon:yes gene_type:complete
MKKLLLIISILTLSFSNGKLSGVSYFSFEDNFNLSRVYLTYKKSISDDLSFKFQTDVGPLKDYDDDTRYVAFLKKGQFDWKMGDGMKLSMGMIGMNMFNIQEKTWGYRFLRKSAMDEYKFSPSADLGISFSKDFGFLSTSLMISNGEGYKASSVDDKNKISFQLLHGEKRLDKKDGYNIGVVCSSLADDNDEETAVMGLFGGWSGYGLRVGTEYNVETIVEMKNSLTSFYLNYEISDCFSAFVRQDTEDEDVDTDGGDESTMMAGVVWQPKKGLSICPNITQIDDEDTFSLDFQFKF